MIVVQPSPLNGVTFTSILHLLYVCSASCPKLAVTLLKMNIAETLVCLLTGSAEGKPPGRKSIVYKSAALTNSETTSHSPIQQSSSVEILPRTPQELHEIVSLIGEMVPRLPTDEPLFQVDQFFRASQGHESNVDGPVLWYWQDDQGQLSPYSAQDSRTIENAWQQHEEEVQLNISGRQYLLDLQQLQQVNEETNQARFIKRVVSPTSPEPPTLTTEYESFSDREPRVDCLCLGPRMHRRVLPVPRPARNLWTLESKSSEGTLSCSTPSFSLSSHFSTKCTTLLLVQR